MTVTKEEIVELRRLLGEATQGKWKLWGGEVRADMDGTSNLDASVLVCVPEPRPGRPLRVPNAYLIAAMQRALPDLLDIAERAHVRATMVQHDAGTEDVGGKRCVDGAFGRRLSKCPARGKLSRTIVSSRCSPMGPWK